MLILLNLCQVLLKSILSGKRKYCARFVLVLQKGFSHFIANDFVSTDTSKRTNLIVFNLFKKIWYHHYFTELPYYIKIKHHIYRGVYVRV